jgi:hypothetical protein
MSYLRLFFRPRVGTVFNAAVSAPRSVDAHVAVERSSAGTSTAKYG